MWRQPEGWLYLAVIINLFRRRVVGWSMRPHMKVLFRRLWRVTG